MEEDQTKPIFTIVYDVNGQKYAIGITHDAVPEIAAVGMNTTRPLPKNMRDALIEMVMEVKQLNEPPHLVDYNAPTSYASRSLLGNFSVTPINAIGPVIKDEDEVIRELKAKLLAQQK